MTEKGVGKGPPARDLNTFWPCRTDQATFPPSDKKDEPSTMAKIICDRIMLTGFMAESLTAESFCRGGSAMACLRTHDPKHDFAIQPRSPRRKNVFVINDFVETPKLLPGCHIGWCFRHEVEQAAEGQVLPAGPF
jgi:hypothetical protein